MRRVPRTKRAREVAERADAAALRDPAPSVRKSYVTAALEVRRIFDAWTYRAGIESQSVEALTKLARFALRSAGTLRARQADASALSDVEALLVAIADYVEAPTEPKARPVRRAASALQRRSPKRGRAAFAELGRAVQHALSNKHGLEGEAQRIARIVLPKLGGSAAIPEARVTTLLESWARRPRDGRPGVREIVTTLATESGMLKTYGVSVRAVRDALENAGLTNKPRAHVREDGSMALHGGMLSAMYEPLELLGPRLRLVGQAPKDELGA